MAEQFYYVDGPNRRIGPLPWEVLVQLRRAGVITDETLVASEDLSGWTPFAELGRKREQLASLPPVPGRSIPTATRKRHRGSQKMVKWIVTSALVALTLGIVSYLVFFFPENPYLKFSKLNPRNVPLLEIADAIESMPKTWHPVPDPTGMNQGFMLLITGENGAQVRAIPDHPGLYQIDVTRYGLIYDRLPATLRTRNSRSLVLYLGTEFKGGRWHLIEAKGGSVDQVTQPGQVEPEVRTTEWIEAEDAMWHGQWVVDFLNSTHPGHDEQKENEARFLKLEEAFLTEHAKIEALRAQGITVPE
jgi:hypothetical protein